MLLVARPVRRYRPLVPERKAFVSDSDFLSVSGSSASSGELALSVGGPLKKHLKAVSRYSPLIPTSYVGAAAAAPGANNITTEGKSGLSGDLSPSVERLPSIEGVSNSFGELTLSVERLPAIEGVCGVQGDVLFSEGEDVGIEGGTEGSGRISPRVDRWITAEGVSNQTGELGTNLKRRIRYSGVSTESGELLPKPERYPGPEGSSSPSGGVSIRTVEGQVFPAIRPVGRYKPLIPAPYPGSPESTPQTVSELETEGASSPSGSLTLFVERYPSVEGSSEFHGDLTLWEAPEVERAVPKFLRPIGVYVPLIGGSFGVEADVNLPMYGSSQAGGELALSVERLPSVEGVTNLRGRLDFGVSLQISGASDLGGELGITAPSLVSPTPSGTTGASGTIRLDLERFPEISGVSSVLGELETSGSNFIYIRGGVSLGGEIELFFFVSGAEKWKVPKKGRKWKVPKTGRLWRID